MTAEGVRDDREVDDPVSAHAAAALRFGHEQRRPPQLAALAPVRRIEPVVSGRQVSDAADRALGRQEPPRRVAEELLVVGERQLHGTATAVDPVDLVMPPNLTATSGS